MNLPAVDLPVAITVFASVATLQVLYQVQRAMKRHPAQDRPRFMRRLALMFLLSCVALLAIPALAGMFLSQLSPRQSAAAPSPMKDRPASGDAAFSPSSPIIDSDSTQEPVASLPAAPFPSRPSAPIASSPVKVQAPAVAAEEPEELSSGSNVDEAQQAEIEQSEQVEPQPEEADSQPEGQPEPEPEGLFEGGDVELPLDPDLPGVGR